jgi:putative superfamily III holin-X
MHREDRRAPTEAQESTPNLLGRLFHDGAELLKKEFELARAEVADDVKAGVGKLIGFATAALFAIVGLGLFAAAAVLALAGRMPAWEAALLVGVAFFVIAGIAGAVARAQKIGKLERTQRTVKEDVRWAKERMA